MDGNEVTTGLETQETTEVVPAAEEQPASDQTPEKVSALQKFISTLFSGKKEGAGTETQETVTTPKAQESGTDAKTFTEDEMSAAMEAEKQKWLDELAEAERVKQLSPEERQKEEQLRKDAEITSLKTQLLQKELKDAALADLENEGYSVKLADILDYSSKESMEKSLNVVKTVVKESLEAAIKIRLKGKTPAGLGGAATAENMIQDQIARNIRGGMM